MDRGRPAIQPRSASIPSFTEHDVRDYLSRGVSLGKIELLGQPTIIQVAFTTIRELDRAGGERYFEANYPADLPIRYVKLSGTFRVFGPPGLGAAPGASISAAFILIDACTGNVFVTGTPSRARWA
jgi:hypothetical protein